MKDYISAEERLSFPYKRKWVKIVDDVLFFTSLSFIIVFILKIIGTF